MYVSRSMFFSFLIYATIVEHVFITDNREVRAYLLTAATLHGNDRPVMPTIYHEQLSYLVDADSMKTRLGLQQLALILLSLLLLLLLFHSGA